MMNFVISKCGLHAIQKSEIVSASILLHSAGDASIIFELKSGDKKTWINYYQNEAKEIVKGL